MIIQPILEELESSLQRCFSQEAEGLYTLQKEQENLQLLAAGVASHQQQPNDSILEF